MKNIVAATVAVVMFLTAQGAAANAQETEAVVTPEQFAAEVEVESLQYFRPGMELSEIKALLRQALCAKGELEGEDCPRSPPHPFDKDVLEPVLKLIPVAWNMRKVGVEQFNDWLERASHEADEKYEKAFGEKPEPEPSD
jgi:hypothetical protein